MNTVIKAYKKDQEPCPTTPMCSFLWKPIRPTSLAICPLRATTALYSTWVANIELLAHELAMALLTLSTLLATKLFGASTAPRPNFAEKTTQNLMDYTNGTELWKYQWDLIHDPERIVLGALDEEEGAAYAINLEKLIQQLRSCVISTETDPLAGSEFIFKTTDYTTRQGLGNHQQHQITINEKQPLFATIAVYNDEGNSGTAYLNKEYEVIDYSEYAGNKYWLVFNYFKTNNSAGGPAVEFAFETNDDRQAFIQYLSQSEEDKNALSDEATKLFRQRLKAALPNGEELVAIINDGLCKPEDIRWLDAAQRVQAISSLMGLGNTSEYTKESALLKVLDATTGSSQAIAKEFIEKLDVGSNMSALLKQFDDLYGEEKFDGLFSALYRIWLKSGIGTTTDISVLYPLSFGYNKTKVNQEVRLEDEFVDVWVGEFKVWGATDIKTAFEGHQKYLNDAIGITFMEPNELFDAPTGTTISVPPFVLSYLNTRESNANLRATIKGAAHITINAIALYTGVQGAFVAKNGIVAFFAWADVVSTSGAILVSTDIVKAKLKDDGGMTDTQIKSLEDFLFATQLVTTGGVIISPKFAKFDDAHAALTKVGKEKLEAIDPNLVKVKNQMDEMAGEIVGAEKVVVQGADNVLSRLNKSVIDDLNKLTPETKTKILNDIAADANFEKFVNDNPVISKAFSAHKNDLTQLELNQIDDLLKRSDIPTGAKSWATRGMTLRNMLVVSRQFDDLTAFEEIKRLYPNSYGRQITLKVTNKALAKDNVLEIVPDYLVRDGGKYKIVDAKYTSKAADDFELQKALTPNQDDVFGWLTDPKYKGKIEIEVRANNSRLTNLDLEQGGSVPADNIGIEVLQSQAGNPNAIEKTIKIK
jgi:hypothetical protein